MEPWAERVAGRDTVLFSRPTATAAGATGHENRPSEHNKGYIHPMSTLQRQCTGSTAPAVFVCVHMYLAADCMYLQDANAWLAYHYAVHSMVLSAE